MNVHESFTGVDPTLVLPGVSNTEVSAARRFVERQAAELAHRTSVAMQLVVSELVSNALVHGSPGSILVTVSIHNGRASLRVASQLSHAADLPPQEDWSVASVSSLTGRGLGIVKAVSDRVRVVRQGRHLALTVTFEI